MITTYAHNSANQLLTAQDNTGVTTFAYDTDGNQIKRTVPGGGVTTYNWDYENRLTRVVLTSGTRNTFQYDSGGKRVRKDDSAGTAKFIWDEENVLLETNQGGTTQVVYTLEPAAYGNLLSEFRSSATHYYHFDGLGSTDSITNASAGVTDNYVYEAFGSTKMSTETTVNPFRYVGRFGYYFDPDLGQYYVRHRAYSPSLGRWLSREPFLLIEGPNFYAYVSNRPINAVDVSGLIPAGMSAAQARAAQPRGAEIECPGITYVCSCPLSFRTNCAREAYKAECTLTEVGGEIECVCRCYYLCYRVRPAAVGSASFTESDVTVAGSDLIRDYLDLIFPWISFFEQTERGKCFRTIG